MSRDWPDKRRSRKCRSRSERIVHSENGEARCILRLRVKSRPITSRDEPNLSRQNEVVTQHTEAIFEEGLLRRLEFLSLRDKQRVLSTINDVSAPGTNSGRMPELEWLKLHGQECSGQRVALNGEEVPGNTRATWPPDQWRTRIHNLSGDKALATALRTGSRDGMFLCCWRRAPRRCADACHRIQPDS